MEQRHALLVGDEVRNVIVTGDDTPDGWLGKYVADHPEFTSSIDVDSATPVSIGWLRRANKFVAPYELSTDKPQIKGDDKDTATVTYVDNHQSPPASVEAKVNGQPTTVSLTNGSGQLSVTSGFAGDTVLVEFPGASITLAVT